jgi:hypothetical protein
VDQNRSPSAEQPVEFGRGMGDDDVGIGGSCVTLDQFEFGEKTRGVAVLRWGAVGLGQVHLVERRVQHGQHRTDIAFAHQRAGHARPVTGSLVVGES